MRYFLITILFTFIISAIKTQIFNRTYNHFSEPYLNPNTGNLLYQLDAFHSIVLTDSFYLIDGTTTKYLQFNYTDQYIVKIDFYGNIIEEKVVNLIDFGRESVANPYIYNNGTKILAGRITDGTFINANAVVVKMDEDSNIEFINQFSFGSDSSFPNFVTTDSGKAFYFLGFADVDSTSNINYDVFIAKIDSSGTLLDAFQFGGLERDLCSSIHVLENGNMLIAGETDSYGAGNTDLYLFETDTLGNMLWHQTYGYLGNEQYGKKNALYVTPNEEFYLCGITRLQGGNAIAWLVKTDRQGNMLWEKKYERGQFFDYFSAIHPAPDGTLIVIGSRNDYEISNASNSVSRPMAWVLKMDTSGNIIWERLITIHDDPFDTDVYVNQSLLAPDGGVVMAGYVIANYIETDGVLHLNDGWACKTDSCGFTTGDIPEPLFVIESQNDLEISIDNLSENYCTATLTWGDGEQEPIYAYSAPIYGYTPNLTHTYTQPGTYEICLEALAGEEYRTYCTEVVLEPNSLASASLSQLEVKIFPNPTNNYFILELPLTSTPLSQQNGTSLSQQNENPLAERSRSQIQIYNLNGQLVHQLPIKNQPQQKIDIHNLPQGVYIIKIYSSPPSGELVGAQKLVVVR